MSDGKLKSRIRVGEASASKRNHTLHAIKRLIVFTIIIALNIWCMFSVYRFLVFAAVMLLLLNLPFYIHRRLARKLFDRDGFQLLRFGGDSGAFVCELLYFGSRV